MFTGLVEELGEVLEVNRLEASLQAGNPADGGMRLRIGAQQVLEDARIGSSIAVNGCCLTAVALGPGWWEADVVRETVQASTLGRLRRGDTVNLERPLRLSDRLGGHLVQGHVDAVAEVTGRTPLPDGSARLSVAVAGHLRRYLVTKGSVALDGVSLTIAGLTDLGCEVAIVPHTGRVTTLGAKEAGDPVNLEVDLVAKYLERLQQPISGREAPDPSAPEAS